MPELETQNTSPDIAMSLGQHLIELRKRLVYSAIGAVVCITFSMYFSTDLILALEKPYIKAMKSAGLTPQLQSLQVMGGFLSYFKIATWAGLIMASPWIFFQLWKFVSAGLYPRERRYVYIAAPTSAFLFIAGCSLCIFVIATPAIQFSVAFNNMLNITSFFSFPDYISFVVNMMVAFGLSFQTPVVLYFLNRFGLLSLATLNKYRRYVILIAVIAASVISPSADIFSFGLLSVSLYALYEIGVLAIWIGGRKETKSF
jgi:sec-independent protein translocase protein TatC